MSDHTGNGVNWDNFHLFLAVAEKGSLRKAAASLGMSHATLSRRLNAFEKSFGVALLERRGNRYVLTEAGQDVYATSQGVNQQLNSLHLRLAGQDTRLEGQIRVTLPEILLDELAPEFIAFHELHPNIELEISAVNQLLNLHQRDADIALRVTHHPPSTLVGRRFGDFGYSICAARDLLVRYGTDDFTELPWVGWSSSLNNFQGRTYMEQHFPAMNYVARVDSPQSMTRMVLSGVGVGHLPYLIEQARDDVVRLTQVGYESAGEVWLLTHPDVRHTARFRALLDFLGARLAEYRPRWDPF